MLMRPWYSFAFVLHQPDRRATPGLPDPAVSTELGVKRTKLEIRKIESMGAFHVGEESESCALVAW